jgi:nucleoside-diphosphate-sugar epimerase
MRVLVIGGTGFIGAWITRQLLERGDYVVVVHQGRVHARDLPKGARSVISTAPLCAPEPYRSSLRHGEPDVVIHVMAMTQPEADAAVRALAGRTGRFVVLSSGDVYRAYGRFIGLEPGPPDPTPLTPETSPLRSRLYPHRTAESEPGSLSHDYDKIPVEQAFEASPVPCVTLRLPKVYGPSSNADLATVYGFADQPQWRWTHGYVENIAAAVVFAAAHPAVDGCIYNLGEAETPTVSERLRHLPKRPRPSSPCDQYDFRQDLAFDTTAIRTLGFADPIPYEEGLRRTLDTP